MTVKTPTKSTATAKASSKAVKGAPLTEAELLKMSEKDYMNAAQLDFFRQKLLTLKNDILKNASETTEHLRENILVPDPADRATIEEEHALELRTRDRERKLLKKVENYTHRQWNFIIKKYVSDIISYNPGNKIFLKKLNLHKIYDK